MYVKKENARAKRREKLKKISVCGGRRGGNKTDTIVKSNESCSVEFSPVILNKKAKAYELIKYRQSNCSYYAYMRNKSQFHTIEETTVAGYDIAPTRIIIRSLVESSESLISTIIPGYRILRIFPSFEPFCDVHQLVRKLLHKEKKNFLHT